MNPEILHFLYENPNIAIVLISVAILACLRTKSRPIPQLPELDPLTLSQLCRNTIVQTGPAFFAKGETSHPSSPISLALSRLDEPPPSSSFSEN